jgi:hypothetical protein
MFIFEVTLLRKQFLPNKKQKSIKVKKKNVVFFVVFLLQLE